MTDRYAVIGNPVSHSKSPFIHGCFARQTGAALEYTTLPAEPARFRAAVEDFFRQGGKGLNVTVPFKQEAWKLAARHSDDASLAGAVNTLLHDDMGELAGYNTDGIGLVRDILHNHGAELAGQRVLILGAGGASRGILLPLLREKPAHITIANRTVSRAEELAEVFRLYGDMRGCGFEALAGQRFDWVLNATSASLRGDLPPLPEDLLAADAWCYDLMYADAPTVFCRWARAHGAAQAVDGLGMLVEQAAESFRLWRGVRPDTADVIARLRNVGGAG